MTQATTESAVASVDAGGGVAARSKVAAWWQAVRPRTLVVGAVPVLVGTAVAMRATPLNGAVALAALVGALLIQAGTNLANDYFDFRSGADTADRLGPVRASAAGLLPPGQVAWGAVCCFGAAVLVGAFLVAHAGWPLLVIGLLSIAAGYAYTGGPFPLAYNGLGEAFVLLFFGWVAVCGSEYVQHGAVSALAVFVSVPVGALGVAILSVNNLRDMSTDEKARKRTLAVRFGRRFAQFEYLACLILAVASPIVAWQVFALAPKVLWSAASVALGFAPLRIVWTQSGRALNGALAQTARLMLVYGVVLAWGLLP